MDIVWKYIALGVFLLLLSFGILGLKATFFTEKGCREVCRETPLFSGVYACGKDCSGTSNLNFGFFIMVVTAFGIPSALFQYSMPKEIGDFFGYGILTLEKDEKKRIEYYRSLGLLLAVALTFAYVAGAIIFLLG
jgi:hypothetical protein